MGARLRECRGQVLSEPAMQDSLKGLALKRYGCALREIDDLVKREAIASKEVIKAAAIRQ
jgi:hypothetical protein